MGLAHTVPHTPSRHPRSRERHGSLLSSGPEKCAVITQPGLLYHGKITSPIPLCSQERNTLSATCSISLSIGISVAARSSLLMPLSTTLRRYDMHLHRTFYRNYCPSMLPVVQASSSRPCISRDFSRWTRAGRDLIETALTMAPLVRGPQTAEQVAAFVLFSFFMSPARNAVVRAINRRRVHETPHYRHWTWASRPRGRGVTGNGRLAPWCGLESDDSARLCVVRHPGEASRPCNGTQAATRVKFRERLEREGMPRGSRKCLPAWPAGSFG